MRRRKRRVRSRKRKNKIYSFRFGIDQTPAWMNSFIESRYAIPCSAKTFGPNNKKVHQKWLFIQNEKEQLASKGDIITLTKAGTLIVSHSNTEFSV